MAKKVVLVGCIDFRLQPRLDGRDALKELQQREGVEMYRIQLAGGIRFLVERYDVFLSSPYLFSIEKAVKEGGASEIWSMLHGGGCAGYSDVSFLTPKAEFNLHTMHIAKAGEIFRRHFEAVTVRGFYAHLKPGTTDEFHIDEILTGR